MNRGYEDFARKRNSCFLSLFVIIMASAAAARAQAPDAIGAAGWLVSGPGGGSLLVTRVGSTSQYAVTIPGPVTLGVSVYIQCKSNSCAQGVQYSIRESDSAGGFPSTSLLNSGPLVVGTPRLSAAVQWKGIAPGQYQLSAMIDPNHNYGSDTSADNGETLTLTVTNADPVAIRGWSVSQNGKSIPVTANGNSYAASSAVSGAPVNLSVVLQCNLYGCASVPFQIRQTAGQGSFDTGVVSSGVLGPASAQAQGALSTSMTPITWTPSSAGQYQFAAVVDPNHQFAENASAAADNTETLTITVVASPGGSTPSGGTTSPNPLAAIGITPKGQANSGASGTSAGTDQGSLRGGQSLPKVNVPAPCCNITAINSATGVVTAKVNSTGQAFQFTLVNKAALSQLHAGQGVYANFGAKQVSLDGKSPAGTIVNIAKSE